MGSFLTHDTSYEAIVLREDEFHGVIQSFAPRLFPEWQYGKWAPLLEGPAGRARPDAVLVKDDLSSWYVVEVELAAHPLEHFRGQFDALAHAMYGRHLAAGVADALGRTAPDETIEQLLRSVRPGLAVIADDVSERLQSSCQEFGFELVALHPYRGEDGSFALQVVRSPSALASQRALQLLQLEPRGEFLGQLLFALPATLALPDRLTLIIADDHYDEPVRVIGGRRSILVNPSLFPSYPDLVLEPVDPLSWIFRVRVLDP